MLWLQNCVYYPIFWTLEGARSYKVNSSSSIEVMVIWLAFSKQSLLKLVIEFLRHLEA